MTLTRLVALSLLLAAAPSFAVSSSVQELSLTHPWTVQFSGGCRGVLIHPSWVLTAAHCGPYITSGTGVMYRIDWAKNLNETVAVSFSPIINQGWFPHPDYNTSSFANDVALVRLSTPMPIDAWTQVASLPRAPIQLAEIGVAVGPSGTTSGTFNVFRGPIESAGACLGGTTDFCVKSATAALCQGDSGSGFVTITNGRATARGIASRKSGTASCGTPGQSYGEFEDVSKHTQFILSTIGTTLDSLDGQSRLRSSGAFPRGSTRITCTSTLIGTTLNLTQNGSMNVPGARVGVSCPAFGSRTVSARCLLDSNATARISGFTLRSTTTSSGAVTVTSLPFSNSAAVWNGTVPSGVIQEFDCQVTSEPIVFQLER